MLVSLQLPTTIMAIEDKQKHTLFEAHIAHTNHDTRQPSATKNANTKATRRPTDQPTNPTTNSEPTSKRAKIESTQPNCERTHSVHCTVHSERTTSAGWLHGVHRVYRRRTIAQQRTDDRPTDATKFERTNERMNERTNELTLTDADEDTADERATSFATTLPTSKRHRPTFDDRVADTE